MLGKPKLRPNAGETLKEKFVIVCFLKILLLFVFSSSELRHPPVQFLV